MKRLLMALMALFSLTYAYTKDADSVTCVVEDSCVKSQEGLVNRIINYFEESNKKPITDHLDISFMGGPHYSSDSKFGIGLMAAGLYSTAPEDTLTIPSRMDVFTDLTTAGHFKVGYEGEHITPGNNWWLAYNADFSSIATRYWGIGYDECADDDIESKYSYFAVNISTNFSRKILNNFYIGPLVTFDYYKARRLKRPWMWAGLPLRTFNWGLGFTLRYDTRDNPSDPKGGVRLQLDQIFYSARLGNKYGFICTEATAAWYRGLWKGATLASQLHARITWGDTPWTMMSTIGGSHNMRGYFEGRYRDKSEIDACVEIRQNVWGRNGIVVWGGAASIFPKFSAIRGSQILPNWGVGYRWEFKKHTNIRIDYGFGRHQSGIIFNINEAF